MNALGSKLNAVLERERHTEDPTSCPASPSLASTSSEALQYHPAVYRKPPTQEDQTQRDEKCEYMRSLWWGDEKTRRSREEQFKKEDEALRNLAMCSWRLCEGYEEEASRLMALRAVEDRSRNNSAEIHNPAWKEDDQLALEFQRQTEDYLTLTQTLSIFLNGDEESENKEVLRYRLKNLKTLLRLYDSQWHESLRRLEEAVVGKTQQSRDLTELEVDDHDSNVQAALHNASSGRERVEEPVENESPGLVDSPKASNAAKRKRIGQPGTSVKAEAKSSPVGDSLRRSRRIRTPVPSVCLDSTVAGSAYVSKRIRRQNPRRSVANNAPANGTSAEPQGVSKRQQAKKIQRIIRKD